jgi:hypothetical protein
MSASSSPAKHVRSRRPHTVAPSGASAEARRLAAVILEVLAGSRTPGDAARAVGTSLPRYYLLEQRAIAGLLSGCERRPKGPRQSEARQVARLERELARLQKECGRQQALARLAQRAVGLPAPQAAPVKPAASNGNGNGNGNGKKSRKRRPVVRALRAAQALAGGLVADPSSPTAGAGVQPSPGENGEPRASATGVIA